MNKRPIGIFDSGVGGLTVLREIEKLLPHEDIVYFGDTARLPYGNKSKSTVVKFSTQSLLFLLRKKVKLVVVACNTSSSLALDSLKRAFSIPITGVIEAGVKRALEVSTNRLIGVIGTRSTINSRSYEKEIKRKDKKVKVYPKSCPLFVPLAEEGMLDGEIVDEVVKMYLATMKAKQIDTLILGCTHYPLFERALSGYLNGTNIVDSAQAIALSIQQLLKAKGLSNPSGRKGKQAFYVSDEPSNFSKLAKLFLKRNIPKPKVIHV